MSDTKLLLARIKQLEKDRDHFVSERDKLLLDRKTVLLHYSEWLKNHEFVITMNSPKDLVTSYQKAIKKAIDQKQKQV